MIENYPLEWIDEYVARLREFIFVREADRILIKVPNEAYKLNESGVRILRRLFDGESVMDFWAAHGRAPEVRRDLYRFFVGLKQVLQGCLREDRLPEAVEARPFALGFHTLPILSEIALTYRCNLRCRFCYAGCNCTRGSGGEEMSTDEVGEVLRVLREDAQVPSVSFTGGEPTLRSDLSDLIRRARSLGLRVNLITNGTRIDAGRAAELAAAGLHSAQVSLESPDEAVHDRLVDVPGAFRRSVAAVGRLQAQGIHVHTNTTINRENLATVAAMPAFVRGLGLSRFSMNLTIPAGSSGDVHAELNVRYREMPDVILGLSAEARRQGVEFLWYSPTPVCIFNPVAHRLGNKGCAACDGLVSVAPNGDVLPCSSWADPVGNVLRDGFGTVWESARARSLRAKESAPPACIGCTEFALCQGACPLYWNHFGHEELTGKGSAHVASAAATT